jgi:hypothetical protein
VKIVFEDESGHKGIDRAAQINKKIINGNDYRRIYDNATDNPKLNKLLYDTAKIFLEDRSGTRYESMCWIDGDTAKIIEKFEMMGRIPELTGETHELKVEYSSAVLHKLHGYNNIIVLHNHPNSTAPSAADFNSAYDHDYNVGFVATHDGRLFRYTSNEVMSELVYNTYWNRFVSNGLDSISAQIRAIEKISENTNVTFEEVLRNEILRR